MEPRRRVQIHQYNDPEILEFFNEHRVRYRLVGDHVFIIRSHGRDVAAGPGDWLTTAAGDELEVKRGDYSRRAQRAIERARRARVKRAAVVPATGSLGARNNAGHLLGSRKETLTEIPESETLQWKTRVEAEARDRLKRKIRHIARNG